MGLPFQKACRGPTKVSKRLSLTRISASTKGEILWKFLPFDVAKLKYNNVTCTYTVIVGTPKSLPLSLNQYPHILEIQPFCPPEAPFPT